VSRRLPPPTLSRPIYVLVYGIRLPQLTRLTTAGGTIRYAAVLSAVLVSAEYFSASGAPRPEISGARLLAELSAGDRGAYLDRASAESAPGMEEGSAAPSRWDLSALARPYGWAQDLAGLPLPAGASDTDQALAWRGAANNDQPRKLHVLMARLVKRVQVQLSLEEQLATLALHQVRSSSRLYMIVGYFPRMVFFLVAAA
jgi:hypothetical protein